MTSNDAYAVKWERWCKNKKLDRNAYYVLRKSVMKYKSKLLLFHDFNFLEEYTYVNKATSLTFYII